MIPYDGVTLAAERRLNPSLAERLRTETRELHSTAERSSLMNALMGGRMERQAYCALLGNLHAIYAALEPALARHARRPMIAAVFQPALVRTGALEHDLRVLHGPAWADELALKPAALAYVGQLRDLDASQPDLLLAHAYVRYLGDLSGGQMLRKVVAKNPMLAGEAAVAFYDFGDVVAARGLAKAFRLGLAAASVVSVMSADDRLADALVEEARLAFELHRQLFEELAG